MTLPRSAVSLALIAALVAGVWALVDRRVAQRTAEAERLWPPEGQFVDLDGRRVHAVVLGQGPDLVLIHGSSGNTRDFTFDLAGRLADRYRVIVLDRPGLGYSDRARPGLDAAWTATAETAAQQAAMLQAAAAALGADRPIVVGHSYGGAVALAWALNHPEAIAAYVSLAGVAMPWTGSLGPYYTALGSAPGSAILAPLASAFATKAQMQSAVAGVFAPQAVPPGYLDHFGVPLSLRLDSFRANARQVNALLPEIVSMSQRYGDLTLPIEILHGDADTTVPMSVHSAPFAGLVPSAHLTVLPGVGHMPHHADPAAAVAAIDRAAARAGLR